MNGVLMKHKDTDEKSDPPLVQTTFKGQTLVKAQIQDQEKALDEALELTFPASDPIAVSHGVPDQTPAFLGRTNLSTSPAGQ